MTEVHHRNPLKFRWLGRIGIFVLLLGLIVSLWLLNVSKPGTKVTGCWQGCATNEAENGRSLHILSLNILHDYPSLAFLPQRLDLVAAEIKRWDIDIALLQEVPNSRLHGDSVAYLAQQTGLNYAYLRANGNRRLVGFEEGVVILSRFPLQGVSFTELDPQASRFEHRVVLHAVAIMPQSNLDLFVTHLTNGAAAANKAQTESLQTFVANTAKHTAVIAGDFNAAPDSIQIQQLAPNWIDVYQSRYPESPGWTCCVVDLTQADNNSIDERVDYLFLVQAVPDITLQDVQLVLDQPFITANGPLWASDHIGILVTLHFSPKN